MQDLLNSLSYQRLELFYRSYMSRHKYAVVVVAYLVEDLSLVLDIDGSIVANLTAFILPALYHLKIRSSLSTETGKRARMLSTDNFGQLLTCVFGFASLALGTQEVISHLLE